MFLIVNLKCKLFSVGLLRSWCTPVELMYVDPAQCVHKNMDFEGVHTRQVWFD